MLREVLDLLGGEKALAGSWQPRARERKNAGAGAAAHSARSGSTRNRSAGTRKVVEEPAANSSIAEIPATPQAVFRASAIDNLGNRLDVAPDELMRILGIIGRTAQRRRQQEVLSSEESDRLYRLARIVERAFQVFACEDAARQWLKRSQAIFKGAAPLALLGGEAGMQAVQQQLGRIDYGDLH